MPNCKPERQLEVLKYFNTESISSINTNVTSPHVSTFYHSVIMHHNGLTKIPLCFLYKPLPSLLRAKYTIHDLSTRYMIYNEIYNN